MTTALLRFMLLVMAPAALLAARLAPLSIETLATRAELIVRGTVVRQSCQRDAAGRIFTRVELAPADTLKGHPAGGTVTLVHGGGRLGQIQTTISGQAAYRLDEEVVVFLVRNPHGQWVTLGMAQGKFGVHTADGRQYASNGVSEEGEPAGSSGGPRPLALEELRARVRQAIEVAPR